MRAAPARGRSRSPGIAVKPDSTVPEFACRLYSPGSVSTASNSWWLESAGRQLKELQAFFGAELEKATARQSRAIAACQDRFDSLLAKEREERIQGLAALGRELGDRHADPASADVPSSGAVHEDGLSAGQFRVLQGQLGTLRSHHNISLARQAERHEALVADKERHQRQLTAVEAAVQALQKDFDSFSEQCRGIELSITETLDVSSRIQADACTLRKRVDDGSNAAAESARSLRESLGQLSAALRDSEAASRKEFADSLAALEARVSSQIFECFDGLEERASQVSRVATDERKQRATELNTILARLGRLEHVPAVRTSIFPAPVDTDDITDFSDAQEAPEDSTLARAGAAAQVEATPPDTRQGSLESDLRRMEAEVRGLKNELASLVLRGEAGEQVAVQATLDGLSTTARLSALEGESQRAAVENGRTLAQLEVLRAEVAALKLRRLEQPSTPRVLGALDHERRPSSRSVDGFRIPSVAAIRNRDANSTGLRLAIPTAGAPALLSARDQAPPSTPTSGRQNAREPQLINHTHVLHQTPVRPRQEKSPDSPVRRLDRRSLPTASFGEPDRVPDTTPLGRSNSPSPIGQGGSGPMQFASVFAKAAQLQPHVQPKAHTQSTSALHPRAQACVAGAPCQPPLGAAPCLVRVTRQPPLFHAC